MNSPAITLVESASDLDFRRTVSVVKTLGEVVNVVEERPVIRSVNSTGLLAGKPRGFLDLRLVNPKGEEIAVRVPVESEVLDFYAR